MGCNCSQIKKQDLSYIKIMAGHHANLIEKNVQVYEYKIGTTKVYDFEEEGSRREGVVHVVKFSGNKSKTVLRDSGKGESAPVKKTPKKQSPRRRTK